MTSSTLRQTPDLGFSRPASRGQPRQESAAADGARSSVLPMKGAEPWARWAWLVAICTSFLAVGIAGVWADLGPTPRLISWQPNRNDLAPAGGDAVLMADLVAEPESAQVTQETPPEVLEVPQPVDTPPEALDLPELAEALVTEDLFVVPAAPKVEDLLRPLTPAPPKPELKRITRPAAPSTSPSRSMARSNGTGSGAGGSSAGAGTTGRGSFIIPKPSYPSSLRSLGVQGTVRLQVTVGASGRATSVSIIGTSGNSTLDQYAASWVRRNGKAPPGEVRTFVAPLSFVLR